MTSARLHIAAATAAVTSAADLVASAEAACALAVKEASAADERLSLVAVAEHEAAGSLADRIRAAAASGGAVKTAKPSASALSRSSAEAEARAAHAAVALLSADLEQARADLLDAQHGVSLATLGACQEVASSIVERMSEALGVLQDGFRHLKAIEKTAFTLHPKGHMHLRFDDHGQKLAVFDITPGWQSPMESAALLDRWRDWRQSLPADPEAVCPWPVAE